MSMLAEPRRKRKIGPDPNNKHWTEDNSKFGQKMLEKMGWNKGQGLGASDQGLSDPITLNPNLNSRGLGSEAVNNSDDNWLNHQTDFDALLKSLNGANSAAAVNSGEEDKEKKSGLESISKKSRARIHYHKFTRGKDLSNMSAEDRSAIFGKKKDKTEKIEETNGCADDDDDDKVRAEGQFEVSSVSTTDYYKQMMKQKLKKAGRNSDSEPKKGRSCDTSTELVDAASADNDDKPAKKKKKKSKKKSRTNDIDSRSLQLVQCRLPSSSYIRKKIWRNW